MPAVAEKSAIRIVVASDRLQAHLTASVRADQLTLEAIVAALEKEQIPVTADVATCVQQVLDMKQAGTLPREAILLAEGKAATQGTAAVFEFNPQVIAVPAAGSPESENLIDYYRSQIVMVKQGTILGTRSPEVVPVAGIDIYGKPIVPEPLVNSIQLGANVSLGPDGKSVVAACAGKVHLTQRTIGVVPTTETPGDVDASKSIDAPADVLLGGNVKNGASIKSGGSVTVRGGIESATIEAKTDLQVNSSITGNTTSKCSIKVGGEVFARVCRETVIEAGSQVIITREASNCAIRTMGQLVMTTGRLLGGKIYARAGVEVQQLGNGNAKVEVAVGIDPLELTKLSEVNALIKKKQMAIDKIRQSVQPLMAQLKRLTPAQREKATELLYQADEMEQEVIAAQTQRSAVLQHKMGPDGREVGVLVHQAMHPGTELIFGEKMTVISRLYKGPIKIVCRAHNRTEEILAIDIATGTTSALPSQEYTPEPPATAEPTVG